MESLSQQTLRIAQKQIGVEEFPRGSNAGKQVSNYLKSVNLGPGYSWCMAFVYWCVNEACKTYSETNPLKKTGGVLDQYISRKELRDSKPSEGAIFIIDSGGGKGHTGFVEKILPNGMVQTIEGNTNNEGSREGYEVCRRIRSISKLKGFLNLEKA